MNRMPQSPAGEKNQRWQRTGPRQAGLLTVTLVAVAALVAACDGGGANATAPSSARQSGVLFASCMRSHGITGFPDPESDGRFDIPRGMKSEPHFKSASEACQSDLPNGGTAAKHPNIREEVSFASCMRSHGIADFPDPLPGGGWDLPGDTSSPQFAAAARSCQSTGIHWNGS